MIVDDLRKTLEAVVGTLTPTRAQQIARDSSEPGAAKEQVAKLAADLLEWSQTSRERLSTFVRREIADQLKTRGGVATQAEVDALKKRVRDLERAANRSPSQATAARKPAARKASTRKASTRKASTRKASTRKRRPQAGRPQAGRPQAGRSEAGSPHAERRLRQSHAVTRRRLDTELVRRGLAASHAEAQQALSDGIVLVAGAPASKAATLVSDDEPVALRDPSTSTRFVSRGGDKLAAALERFSLDPSGGNCLDAGSSTGGFTDCLLRAGAAHVVAVDVGYGQLAYGLRHDDRVTVLERTNVRDLTAKMLPYRARLLVADLSFISLRSVLPVLADICTVDAEIVLLVKPQFEAARDEIERGGVVSDPGVHIRVLGVVAEACGRAGFEPQGSMASPLRGPAGNVEFLLWARRGARPAALDVAGVVAEGQGLPR